TNGKCRPKESRRTNNVVPNSHHFNLPRTTTHPKTNRKTTPAPKYQGPEVNGFSPQYAGILAAASGEMPLFINTWATFEFASSWVLIPPPYTLGTKNVRLSPTPWLHW